MKSPKRKLYTTVVGILILTQFKFSGDLHGQSQVTGIFGVGLIKPLVTGNTVIKSKFTHNYWVSVNYIQKLSNHSNLHAGITTHALSHRFSSADSPIVIFRTMNNIGLPVILDFKIRNSAFSFCTGLEPKIYITGHEYTAEPSHETRISFEGKNQLFNRYNLAFRTGVIYKKGNAQYTLNLSADMLPYKSYKSTDFYDIRLLFGFNLFSLSL